MSPLKKKKKIPFVPSASFLSATRIQGLGLKQLSGDHDKINLGTKACVLRILEQKGRKSLEVPLSCCYRPGIFVIEV